MANCNELLGVKNSNLQVLFKMKKRPAFKAGAELSSKVNLVSIDVNEDVIEDSEIFEMNINIQKESKCDDTAPISIDAIKEMQARLEERLQYLAQIAEETMKLERIEAEERNAADQAQS